MAKFWNGQRYNEDWVPISDFGEPIGDKDWAANTAAANAAGSPNPYSNVPGPSPYDLTGLIPGNEPGSTLAPVGPTRTNAGTPATIGATPTATPAAAPAATIPATIAATPAATATPFVSPSWLFPEWPHNAGPPPQSFWASLGAGSNSGSNALAGRGGLSRAAPVDPHIPEWTQPVEGGYLPQGPTRLPPEDDPFAGTDLAGTGGIKSPFGPYGPDYGTMPQGPTRLPPEDNGGGIGFMPTGPTRLPPIDYSIDPGELGPPQEQQTEFSVGPGNPPFPGPFGLPPRLPPEQPPPGGWGSDIVESTPAQGPRRRSRSGGAVQNPTRKSARVSTGGVKSPFGPNGPPGFAGARRVSSIDADEGNRLDELTKVLRSAVGL